MRAITSLVSICVLSVTNSTSAANPQPEQTQNMALAAETSLKGSVPYRETVVRFIEKKEPKIVGGKRALAGAYPWQVSLGVSWIADPYRAHFCGGTVYSATWIVTAAHCVAGNDAKDIVVTAGTNKLGTGGSRRNVERIISKGDYNAEKSDNDIALIQLRDPLVLDGAIKAIPLLTAGEEPEILKKDTPLVVTGWGATVQGGQGVRDLRYVEVPFVERDTCNRSLAYDGKITTNMICAGVAVGGKDSCQGDSGGPLTVNTKTSPRLAGVVSWGDGCAKANRVGVYSRVANYANWVASCVAGPEQCN